MGNIYETLKESAKRLDELLKLNRGPLYEVAPPDSSKSIFEVYESSLNEIVTEIEDNKELLECDFEELAEQSPQLQVIINNVTTQANELLNTRSDDPRYLLKSFENHDNRLRQVLSEIHRIPLLKSLSSKEQSIILIGPNGSGKSSLANYLKSSTMPNILVFPAQKHLYFKENYSHQFNQLNRGSYLGEMKGRSRISPDVVEQTFTKTIAIFVNEYLSQLVYRDVHREEPFSTTILEDLQRTWNLVIPNIELSVDATKRSIVAKSGDGDPYGVNELSDGEKVIIQYILEILMIEPNSFIVVDEPETYINFSIANKLWDVLVDLRKECHFIFITHNIDFIIARLDSKIIWCKSFIYPNNWEFKEIKVNDNGLPIELITEIVGSRKPILFCEGNDKSSFDYKIFNTLFIDKYTVMPVGNCTNVKRYANFYNSEKDYFKNKAIGIIDGDLLVDEDQVALACQSIYVLPFNEIEMLLVSPDVMKSTLTHIYDADFGSTKTKEFYRDLISLVSKRKESIALSQIKKELDERMETQKIDKFNSLEELKDSHKVITNYQFDEKFKEYVEYIENVLAHAGDNDKSYSELLRICNLKNEVVKGMCNKIENNYVDKAVLHLSRDKDLLRLIRQKYFSHIP